ncbi:MAG: TIGR03960 family B12-binding radical SAM protein [Endomicrobia bacterium]|nr:TIGR03960 family B12-binding radical SAM protein [Endomicrobiia bacterium]
MNIEEILKRVSNPAQYIGLEWNVNVSEILSKWSNPEVIKVCLCFPDKYSIGMSNLGIMILYKLLNSYKDILCERVFAVDVDMEKILQKENTLLFSLETNHKLKEFDIIGFSLQDELNYLNIFTILYLAGIPLERKDRKEVFPLVIAGGPCSCNPYVLEDFIDFFILGEAEESIIKVVDIIKKFKILQKSEDKHSLLKKIDELKETYVCGISSNKKVIYPGIVDINKSYYPTDPIVPLVRTAHSRLNIEVTRGCGYSCNFCQATHITKPLRYRDKNKVIYLLEESLRNTGYSEVSFTGFCVTNYPYLLEVIDFVFNRFSNQCISVALPSLRIEDINENLIERLALFRKPTITLALETATERLRKVLNKEVSNEEFFDKLKILYKYGFQKIKLYFMIGLPTETEQDIEEIYFLIKKIKKYFNKIRLNITVSIFIPKPHTPFQFTKMQSYEELYKKIVFLKKNLYWGVNFGNIEKYIFSSYIEALISRGDATVGRFLKKVWEEGERFSNWKENFNLELWKKNLKDINLEEFIFKERDLNYGFIWDNIKYQFSKDILYKKYIDSVKMSNENNSNKSVLIEEAFKLSNEKSTKASFNYCYPSFGLYTLRLKFGRRGKIKFLSHLDEVEIFKKILKLSQIPVCYTQGYNPQIKFSLAPATPVGYESNSEYVDVEIYEKRDKEYIFNSIKKVLPEGFFLIDAWVLDFPLNKIPSLNSCVNLIEYLVKNSKGYSKEKLEEFLRLKEYFVFKIKQDNTLEKINLFEIIKEIKLIDNFTLYLLLRFSPGKNLRPEVVVGNIFNISQEDYYNFDILRNELYMETQDGKILRLYEKDCFYKHYSYSNFLHS